MIGLSAAGVALQTVLRRGGKGRNRAAAHQAEGLLSTRKLRLESLEERALLSIANNAAISPVAAAASSNVLTPSSISVKFDHVLYDAASNGGKSVLLSLDTNRVAGPLDSPLPPPGAKSPQQISTAYGINAIVGNGTGQTIALVDAFDDPTIASDLQAFDAQYGLPACNFTKVNQNGDAFGYPTVAGSTGWSTEIALDVEWAHAIAPGASILLVEADDDSIGNLVTAVDTARSYQGVSVISMSWGNTESIIGDMSSYDSHFTTPDSHVGITFLAASGDDGGPGWWPALSSNVVAVGGTSLTIDGTSYAYVSETAWNNNNGNATSGGQSQYETEPAYQTTVQSSGYRQTPDVSFDADPYTGVAVYDAYGYSVGLPHMSSPWIQVGGTSLSSPCWAGLVATVDQLRVAQGLGTLDGAKQTLPTLYALVAGDLHDITSGHNDGFSAISGYDEVTGRGTPVANLIVPALVSTTIYSANMNVNPSWTFDNGSQWNFGTPAGQSGDPSSGHTGSSVFGYNLSGSYAKNMPQYWATTPVINCSGYAAVSLDYWRWLGVAGSNFAHAYVEISNNGTTWTTVWSNPSTAINDTAWHEQTFDISAVAAHQATVYIRWGMGPTGSTNPRCGWNIDDVTVAGLRTTAPTVASMTPSVTPITHANLGTAGFALSAVFAEAMNTTVSPTIGFPVENPNSTLSFNSDASGWTNSTTYVARFDVADSNVAIPNIDVRVTGATDMAGNVQSQANFPNLFSIDTQTLSVWDGGGGNDNSWMTAANWVGDVAPSPGNQLEFTGATNVFSTNNFAAGTTFDSIIFDNGGFTLSGNRVTLNPQNGVAIDNLAGLNQIDLPITLGSPCMFAVGSGAELSFGAAATIDTNGCLLTYSGSSDDAAASQWQGVVTGGGGLTKTGADTLILTGANSYSGQTTVNGGTLELGSSAQSRVLTGAGANLQAGSIVFDYTGASPASTIGSLLIASYHGGAWNVGQFRTDTTGGVTLGWKDNAVSQVKVMATLPGDVNLDGSVNGGDFAIVVNSFGSAGTWAGGDFNYDGAVNGGDFALLANNFGNAAPVARGSVVVNPIMSLTPTIVSESSAASVMPASPGDQTVQATQAATDAGAGDIARQLGTVENGPYLPAAPPVADQPAQAGSTIISAVEAVVSSQPPSATSASPILDEALVSRILASDYAAVQSWRRDTAPADGVESAHLPDRGPAAADQGNSVSNRGDLPTAMTRETSAIFGQGEAYPADLRGPALWPARKRPPAKAMAPAIAPAVANLLDHRPANAGILDDFFASFQENE